MDGSRSWFVVVEGNDATGKSTLVSLLAERLDAVALSTPPAALKPVRATVDAAYDGDGLARQLFYASTVAWVSGEARRLLAAGRSVVVDRYWLSTRVYDAFRPGVVDLSALEPRLLPADVTVLLETAEEERRRRLFVRGASPADRRGLAHSGEINEGFRRALASPLAGAALVVDTTRTGPTECARRVCDWLTVLQSRAPARRPAGVVTAA
jgi:thymidylate kinase